MRAWKEREREGEGGGGEGAGGGRERERERDACVFIVTSFHESPATRVFSWVSLKFKAGPVKCPPAQSRGRVLASGMLSKCVPLNRNTNACPAAKASQLRQYLYFLYQ
jgi:hypothetical protein